MRKSDEEWMYQYSLHKERDQINSDEEIISAMRKIDPHSNHDVVGSSYYWFPYNKKDGTPSKRWGQFNYIEYSPIYYCESCRKMIHNKKIAPAIWSVFYYYHLCWGCYNKIIPIVKKQKELEEIKKLRNKLIKLSTTKKVRK